MLAPAMFVGKCVKRAFTSRTWNGAKFFIEHMWVSITAVAADGTLSGRLNQDPFYDHGDLVDGSPVTGITTVEIEAVE